MIRGGLLPQRETSFPVLWCIHIVMADSFIWLVDQSGFYLSKWEIPVKKGLSCKHTKPRDVRQNTEQSTNDRFLASLLIFLLPTRNL